MFCVRLILGETPKPTEVTIAMLAIAYYIEAHPNRSVAVYLDNENAAWEVCEVVNTLEYLKRCYEYEVSV